MIDLQLLNTALAGIGFASAAAVLVAIMIIATAAGLRGRRRSQPGSPVSPAVRTSVSAPREPALR
ncbi:MAG TPA: hypothetical protein VF843_05380 [Streptosporangiaceae bacterium]